MANGTRMRLAVLIDGDNVSPTIAAWLFGEIERLGEPIVKRVYGDKLENKWTAEIRKYAMEPRLVVPNTGKKNAADFAFVIDAMDLLHAGRFDGFCLVSSDGDFTRLAMRLRESGCVVYGFGSKRTPESLRGALTQFISIDGTAETAKAKPAKAAAKQPAAKQPAAKKAAAKQTPAKPPAKQPAAKKVAPKKVVVPSTLPDGDVMTILAAIRAKAGADGWVSLNKLGDELNARDVHVRRLSDKLRKLPTLEVDGEGNSMQVRVKRAARGQGAG
jgi:hypothetical protein